MRKIRRKLKKVTPGWIAVYVIMGLLVAFMALPLVYIINSAFKPLDELYIFPPRFFVENPTLQNFTDLFSTLGSATVPFIRNVVNSLLQTGGIVILTCAICALGAYGMVIYHPPGTKLLYEIVVSALMFSAHVTQISRYLVVNELGLINTFWALILPSVASAYNFFLLRQFLVSYPKELIEAGRIAGASELQIFFHLVLPAMKPVLATLIMLSFVSNWNDFFSALIYTTDESMRTLPLALQTIAGGAGSAAIGNAGATAAATMLMTIPTLVLFAISQKHVMETMTYSGIKG